jgi:hypothetical protein
MVLKTKIMSNTHTLLVSKKVKSSLHIPELYQKKTIPDQHWSIHMLKNDMNDDKT